MLKIFKIFFFAYICICSCQGVSAARIKDVASFNGVRDNILVGLGLVVGLNGTGDNLKNSVFTQKGLTDFLERLGVNIQGSDLKTKNIATVTVTANLPAFSHQGTRIDVNVSTIGDAKSLRGGSLLASTLLGADGSVYAVAQGPVVISEFNPVSSDVKSKNIGVETNGFVKNGAIIEAELDFDFSVLDNLRLSLHSPDFSTSLAIVDSINSNISGNVASAIDPATVQIIIPTYRKKDIVQFISEIEQLTIKPDYRAKIVINEATGTVVIGNNVTIRPVAIAQGNLMVTIGGNQNFQEDINNPSLPEKTQDLITKSIDRQRGKQLQILESSTTLNELVVGLNKLGVWPRDIINILQSIKEAGALDATIEVH